MRIKYLTVRDSTDAPRLPNLDATTIGATVNHPEYDLGLSVRDTLGILLEQSLLSEYLLHMNPNCVDLKTYRDNCRIAIVKKTADKVNFLNQLKSEYLTEVDFNIIYDYVVDGTPIVGDVLESIMYKYLKNGSKYTTVPSNFIIPYFQLKTGYVKDEEYYNPVVLSPVYRRDHTDDSISVTFYCKHYTSATPDKTLYKEHNPTMAYICTMNHVGKDWKELVDTVQSFQIPIQGKVGLESLSQILNNYLLNKSTSILTDKKPLKDSLLQVLRYVHTRDNLSILKDDEDTKELVSLFGYLGDHRLRFLLLENPTVGGVESWQSQKDLDFLDDLYKSKKSYVMADSDEDDDSGDEPDDDDESTDDNEPDDEGDDDDEDIFGDDDDFADDDDDSEGDSSGGGSGSSSSGEQTDTASSDDSGDNEEDVNPIIELIEDETFDEYLERGILEIRIKRLITSPPNTLNAVDIQFLKYWYLQWFPCASVATTRIILGSILKVPAEKLTSS